ncbi:hypothetical protein E7Y35_06665 [Spiroplasma sp. SV19]|nr:hypothetical protein E7Y35_06665 [Spiroplasma sp. SV19]
MKYANKLGQPNLSLSIIDDWLFNDWPKIIEQIDLEESQKQIDVELHTTSNYEEVMIFNLQFQRAIQFFVKKMYNKKYDALNIFRDLFIEIEMVLEYILELISIDRNIFNLYERVYPNDVYFHKQVSTYIYVYSLLDKITDLLFWDSDNNKYEIPKNNGKIYFQPHFKDIVRNYIKKTKILEEYQSWIKFVFDSKTYNMLKNLRNSFNHKFTFPLNTYNFSLELLMLIIFIFRIIYSIKEKFMR